MPRGQIGSKTDGLARLAQSRAKRLGGSSPAGGLVDWVTSLDQRLKSVEDKFYESGYDMKRIAQSAVKKRWKIQPQAETFFGLYTAMCIDTLDPWRFNRVRFFSPLLNHPDTPVQALDWAFPISSMGGFDDSGLNWVPPATSMLLIGFERGQKSTPYYLGTTWYRNRGPGGVNFNQSYPVPEWECIHKGHRHGYLVGPNDESQVFPQWNTENYHAFDIDKFEDIAENPQENLAFPNIYGFKTPQKHMMKMVDGDYRCHHRWKRLEVYSGGAGGWMLFKDDHMHPCGQWANPKCGCGSGSCEPCCTDGPELCDWHALEGTGCDEGCKAKCANPYFKHQNECRPYIGPGTPQNNKCELPQTGIQFLSYSGHSFFMDDSVEEPRGVPNWERSLMPFDWGCTNKYEGKTKWISATGHWIELNDFEEPPTWRSNRNWIKLKTANGHRIEMNDHTLPSCIAGPNRGIWIQTTSNHTLYMCDWENEQPQGIDGKCLKRREGGVPVNKAKKAYVRLRTGYGLHIMMADFWSQQKTMEQYLQIFCPQKDNKDCGPHIMHFQEKPAGCGQVFLRVGGDYICSTCCNHYTIVGDKDHPSDKVVVVSRDYVEVTEENYLNVAFQHFFLADHMIYLLAGKDCPDGSGELWPCPAPVLVWRGGIRISDRVIGSCSQEAPFAPIWGLAPIMNNDGGD